MRIEFIPIDKIFWFKLLRTACIEDFNFMVKDGVIKQPINVMECSNGTFEICDGMLRLEVAKKLGFKEINARIH